MGTVFSHKTDEILEKKLRLFYMFLEEGWSPSYSRGKAGVTQSEHIEMKKLSANYEKIFLENHKRVSTVANRAWFKFEMDKEGKK